MKIETTARGSCGACTEILVSVGPSGDLPLSAFVEMNAVVFLFYANGTCCDLSDCVECQFHVVHLMFRCCR